MSKSFSTPAITPRDSKAIICYLKEVNKKKYDPMSNDAIKACCTSYVASKTATKPEGDEKLLHPVINSNLRFVVSVAKRFLNSGLFFEDLVSEGNLGLMDAAKRFDPTLGYVFTTYAKYYIEYYIRTALYKHSRIVKLPEKMIKNYYKIRKFIDNYTVLNGVEPTTEDIAERFGLSEESVSDIVMYNTAVTESLDSMNGFYSDIEADYDIVC